MNEISEQSALTKAFTATLFLSGALFLIFCVGAVISTELMRQELADRLAKQSRRYFLIGDVREAEISYMALVPEVFERIQYFDPSGSTLFSLPPASILDDNSKTSSWHKFMFGRVVVDYSLTNQGAENGKLIFEFRRFSHLGLAFKLALIWILFAIPLLLFLRRRFSNELRRSIESRRLSAIAQTTQMLAHDVRKPFSILRMGLGMLGNAKDPASVKKVLSRLLPEIDKAASSVDGLIADVMEVGSTSIQLIQEPIKVESLIESTLGETFRIYPKASVAITYDLRHSHLVHVHAQKVGRVFSNIVGNAVQAMGQKGCLWFKTRERDGMVEFCIGNAGSVIPVESLPKLFDAFFTSGKKGGTGLGLAIAQKVVTAHGGTIWCESSKSLEHPEGKVEFFFTLPIALSHVSPYKGTLPNHSSDSTKALLALADPGATSAGVQSAEELNLEFAVAAASKKLGRALKILLVDDEEFYRTGLVGMLTHSPKLAAVVAISQASTSHEALTLCESTPYDLAITDVDLGSESPIDGFDLVAALRIELNKNCRNNATICVLSNRIVPSDHKTAIAKGADAFISKPISNVTLLKLLLQTFQSATVFEERVKSVIPVGDSKHRPSVAVLDDNVFILEAWTDALGADSQVFGFASPEDLMETLKNDPDFLNSLACVVTDFRFDNSSVYDGVDVGKLVKSRRPGLAVLLSSDGELKGLDLVGSIDHVIAKAPASLGTLIQRYSL